MTGVISRIGLFSTKFLKSANFVKTGQVKRWKTFGARESPKGSKWKALVIATSVGAGAGAVYSYYGNQKIQTAILNTGKQAPVVWKHFPEKVTISREISYPNDSTGLDLVVFQYPTCPFCCKVRAFLDYFGISYKIVEVNPITKQQLKWTDYKKVPIMLVKFSDGYAQLIDSTMIISALKSLLLDKEMTLIESASYYPNISYFDNDGAVKQEILNRYHLMYQGFIPEGTTKETIVEERKWRKWADDVLVHVLSPNVYRTLGEARESFKWFSEVGEWKKHFSAVEEGVVVNLGAIAMWMIGKRLKKRYALKDDVRQSLYDTCNIWLSELKRKGTRFHGGSKPNLADLAVYGVLNSIEGCEAFSDLLVNTRMGTWFNAMREVVHSHQGQEFLRSIPTS